MKIEKKAAILGCGHIGTAIARGLKASGLFEAENIIVTRRRLENLEPLKSEGFIATDDNREAVQKSDIIIIAVQPQQFDEMAEEIISELTREKHIVMSVVSGVSIDKLHERLGEDIPSIRVMPNTAIAIRESMTCIASRNASGEELDLAVSIFDSVGKTFVIQEELMTAATALCACGIAFFLRAVRAAAQGGIEIGFHSEEAIPMAAQTAKGAASLLLLAQNHPEMEIDKVTTPKGCTISGLNEMEHRGLSSAMIKGIITSAEKAAQLYSPEKR